MTSDLNDFVTLPLSDREVALVRTVLAQFSAHAGRIVQMLEEQTGNPRTSERERRIYVLEASDVERIEAALSDAIAVASTDRKQQLTAIRRWIRRRLEDTAGGE